MTGARGEGAAARVQAWDLPTRIFHWLLVLLILSAWASYEFAETMGDERLVWHRWNGYAVLSLVLWRLAWGFFGSSTSRFSSFVQGPGAAARYARDVLAGRERRFIGHNPLGSFMVLALLAVTLSIGLLGLFAVEENDLATGPLYRLAGGDLAERLTDWHAWLFEPVLLVLIGVHVAANVLYGVVKREPLVPAMITGQKPAAAYEDAAEATLVPHPLWRALLCLVAVKVLLFGGILALGGKLL